MRSGRSRFFCAIIAALSFIGCSPSHSSDAANFRAIDDTTLTAVYPELYEAVFARDAAQIIPFATHQHEQVRSQAWRALAQTPVDSIAKLVEKVEEDDSKEAWFALSMHSIPAKQLRNLEAVWENDAGKRPGISLVLGQQGDKQSLYFLAGQINHVTGGSQEQMTALAISRLMTRFQSSDQEKEKVINHTFKTENAQTVRTWLYGFYRSDELLSPDQKKMLIQQWKDWGIGESAEVDQYMAKIAGPGMFDEIVQHYDSAGTLNQHVQLGIELAQLAADISLDDDARRNLKILLRHENPHVVQQTLAALAGRLQPDGLLTTFIEEEIRDDSEAAPFVWLQALNVLAEINPEMVDTYSNQLQNIAEANPYLYPQAMAVWMKTEDSNAFLNRLDAIISQGDPLKSMYAVSALNDYRTKVEDVASIRDRVRSIAFDALSLGDRGVTYSVQPLLSDRELFNKSDFSKINRYLNSFELPGDIEVYQTFGSLYKERFEAQARPVIDSLAALNYPPLNRSLKQAGWDIDVSEDVETKFRMPNWNRLWQLGEHPVWVLETEKGTIKVKMNTLSAPATVSAIDSLARSGAYDGVPFHRVVPNFVIQGGDIERCDGFGGPDFTIPTESSERGYVRGAAGIASAGPDTEGSQYFFMHQWKPHLNGRYTLFGHVVEGMDIVDRIIVGDKVTRAYWEAPKK